MSMEEWPDDHLDELFRKSAEEYDVPLNNDDWADMSRRLDQLDRQTLFDRISRWGGVGALVLLLLAGLSWVTYDPNSTGSRQPAIITVITPGRELATPLTEREKTGEGSVQSNKAKPGAALRNVPEKINAGIANNVEKQPQATRMAVDPAGHKTTRALDKLLADEADTKASRSVDALPVTVPNTRSASLRKRFVTGSREEPTAVQAARQPVKRRTLPSVETPTLKRGSVADNNLVNSPTANVPQPMAGRYPIPDGNMAANETGNQPAMAAASGERTQPAVTEPSADGPWLPALMPATSLSGVVQQAISPVPEPSLAEETASTPVQRSVPRLSRLSIMLFASPDLSTVGLKNFDRPGSNAGLAVQYQLTDRLSVNTAFMYSTKRYRTASSEYVLPSIPHMYVFPEEVVGVCNMIDIPLNLRYDWLLRPRGNGRAPARWFASAGLTSYFIQHEVYTFQYANPDDPKVKYQPQDWDNRTKGVPGGSFGFSNINLSVGYERPISHRLSWQVEPFMKVPLKPVGNFQVKLLSTGAFVGLRYHL